MDRWWEYIRIRIPQVVVVDKMYQSLSDSGQAFCCSVVSVG